jgi:gamma-glutamyltranspeptidase/glutathione hydrolase
MLSRRDVLRSLGAVTAASFVPGMTRGADTATWERGVVASVQPLATQAGVNALKQGGNAVDAAIAAAITLGVVDQHNSGLGGGCFVLIRRASGESLAIDGREMAPAKATRDMYLRAGKPQPELSQTGPLAVGTPGALAAYAKALTKAGKLKLSDLVQPAAELAERGFPLDRTYANKLKSSVGKLSQFAGSKAALLKSDGSPYAAGEVLKQPDLASTLRNIAEQGPDWFYRGEFARVVGQWMTENGGILAASDFAAYQPIERQPLQTTYRGDQIIGFPPPSSGGVHVAQMLNMLEQFDLAEVQAKGPGAIEHLLAEVMKLAFADRAYWLGDPDFAKVPRGLIDKDYARSLAAKIDLTKATEVDGHGRPPRATENVFAQEAAQESGRDPGLGKHTTHIAAADADGNWVAITATVNTTFGSKVIVPGTGLVLNNEMDDFSISPGEPNAFGLIGAEANAVEPGKRPLSSMSPTIVLRDGQPLLTVGAAGGPTIITQVLQLLVRVLDLKQSLASAVGSPRVHHQWRPDVVRVENSLPEATLAALKERGHRVEQVGTMGVCQAVMRDPATKRLTGVHDPRVPGQAAGV